MKAGRLQGMAAALQLALLSACATHADRPAPAEASPATAAPEPVRQAAAAASGPITTASHEDWRALLPVPFGSALTQVGFALKEVILFQGEAQGAAGTPAASSDDQECYSKSGSAFAFRGAETEDYVLCFFHERLFRIEAALRLPKDAPAESFGQWCDDWLAGLSDPKRDAERCEGREKETQFSATLAYESELAGPLITVIVYDVPAHEAYERRAQKPAPPSRP
jgi:hypothetical protein